MPVTHTSSAEDLLPVGRAARVLGVSPHTMRRYADAGRIPCVRLPSGARRFKRADLLAAIDETPDQTT